MDEIDILYEGQNTPPVQNKLKLKPAPLKAKLKRIQMQKISSIKVREGFDYGLPQSIPHKNGHLTISSILGGYTQHYAEDSEKPVIDGQGEYIEDINSSLFDVKPEVCTNKGDDMNEANREELFKEIEALDDLANLSLSSTLKENMLGNGLHTHKQPMPTQDTATSNKTLKPREFC